MPRCYESGITLGLKDLRLLDAEQAVTELIALRERLIALEQLIDRLGVRDSVERFDPKSRQMTTRLHHRLVSNAIAAEYERRLGLVDLFITMDRWRERVQSRRAESTVRKNRPRSDSTDGGCHD